MKNNRLAKKTIAFLTCIVLLCTMCFGLVGCLKNEKPAPGPIEHEHTWDDGVITNPPSCYATGVKTYHCTVSGCEETKTVSVAKTSHVWDEGTVTQAPTCTEAGVKTLRCKTEGCTATKTEPVSSSGHTWDEGTVVREPSCEEAGDKVYRCTADGCTAEKHEAIPESHDFGDTLNCKMCGKGKTILQLFDGVENMGSNGNNGYVEDVVVDETFTITATANASDGKEKCVTVESSTKVVNGIEFSKRVTLGGAGTVAAIGGEAGTGWRTIAVTVKGACTITVYVGYKKSGATTFAIATAGAEAFKMDKEGLETCEINQESTQGYDFTINKAGTYYIGSTTGGIYVYGISVKYADVAGDHAHVWDDGVVTKAATCTENGERLLHCTYDLCEETLTEVILATGHAWGEGEVTKAATCTEEGEKLLTCTNEGCKETKNETIGRVAHELQDGLCSVCSNTVKTADMTKVPTSGSSTTSITSNLALGDGFTLLANSLGKCGRANSTETYFGLSFTCYINVNGKLNGESLSATDRRAVKVDVPVGNEGKLIVYVKYVVDSKKLSGANLILVHNGAIVSSVELKEGGVFAYEFKITEGGEWYVGTASDVTDVDNAWRFYGAELLCSPAAHEHVWDEGVFTTPATCTASGEKLYHCTVSGCKETKTETVQATGHNWADKEILKVATCTEEGEKTIYCSNEGCTETMKVVVGRPAHEIEDGKCKNCGYVVLNADMSKVPTSGSSTTSITSNLALGEGFTLLANSSGKSGRANSTATYLNVSFTCYINVNGKLNGDSPSAVNRRALKVSVPETKQAVIIVYAKYVVASDKLPGANLILVHNGEVKQSYALSEGDICAFVFNLAEGGDWYIGTASELEGVDNAWRFYGAELLYKTAEHIHSWGEGEVTKPATCTENGVKTYTCSCGETQTEAIIANHNFDADGVCTVCGTISVDFSSLTKKDKVGTDSVVSSEVTIKAASNKTISVAATTLAYNGKTYSKCVDLGGKLNAEAANINANTVSRAVMVTTSGAATITLRVSYKSEGATAIYIRDGSGNDLNQKKAISTDTAEIVEITFTVTEAGTYYIGTVSGGTYVYEVLITPTAA